jgi:hypothetical protein
MRKHNGTALGVSIPTWARNSTCVQHAAYRLRERIEQHGPEETAAPWQKDIIEQYRKYLVEWIEHARPVNHPQPPRA